jgi:hypothetical protein
VFLQFVELASQRVPYFDNPPECDEGAPAIRRAKRRIRVAPAPTMKNSL